MMHGPINIRFKGIFVFITTGCFCDRSPSMVALLYNKPLTVSSFRESCAAKASDKIRCVFSKMALRVTQLLIKYVNGSLSLGIKWPKREIKTITPFYCRVEICVEFTYFHTRSLQAACAQGTR